MNLLLLLSDENDQPLPLDENRITSESEIRDIADGESRVIF